MLQSEFRSRVASYIGGLLVEFDIANYFGASGDGTSFFIYLKYQYIAILADIKGEAVAEDFKIHFNILPKLDLSLAQHNAPLFEIAKCSAEEENAFIENYQHELRAYFQNIILKDRLLNDLVQRIKEREKAYVINSDEYFFEDPKIEFRQSYLQRIEISSFYCIKEPLIVDSLSDKKEIYFLGENGDGKTLLLQAILLGLKGGFIFHESNPTDTGIIINLIRESKGLNIKSIDSLWNEYSISNHSSHDLQPYSNFSVAPLLSYGVHRSRSSQIEEEKYGFLTLFSDKYYLKSPIHWLKDLQRLNGLKKAKGIKLEVAINLLEQILGQNVQIEVDVEVEFIERGHKVEFNQLSEGYKSVITWVADMLARFAEAQPKVLNTKDYKGIVLVDEISLHLHPNWEYGLANKLRTWFPQVQFFFTTHSPVTIMGASDDAVIYRLYKEDGSTKISEPYYAKDMKHLMANSILTSPLFNMEKATMRAQGEWNKDVDTSDDYLHSRIYDLVKKELEKRESEGKVYHSKAMIDGLIQKIMKTQLGKQ